MNENIIEEIKEIISDLDKQIEKYLKNPNHITASGLLVPKALPKYYEMLGKKRAYEHALRMLEREEN